MLTSAPTSACLLPCTSFGSPHDRVDISLLQCMDSLSGVMRLEFRSPGSCTVLFSCTASIPITPKCLAYGHTD